MDSIIYAIGEAIFAGIIGLSMVALVYLLPARIR